MFSIYVSFKYYLQIKYQIMHHFNFSIDRGVITSWALCWLSRAKSHFRLVSATIKKLEPKMITLVKWSHDQSDLIWLHVTLGVQKITKWYWVWPSEMPSQLLDDQRAKIEYDVLKPTTMSLKWMTKRKINKIKALKNLSLI